VRVTIDSNVLVRALTSPEGPALRLLDLVIGSHTLVLSRFILDEVKRVLMYPRLRLRYRITPEEAARFAGTLANVSELVEPSAAAPIIAADPDDDVVLYTASEGRADILCTLNSKHLNSDAAREFCLRRGIRVMGDVEALRELTGQASGN
jgi:putative PIN family toxin of toxin-antitoxin system